MMARSRARDWPNVKMRVRVSGQFTARSRYCEGEGLGLGLV